MQSHSETGQASASGDFARELQKMVLWAIAILAVIAFLAFVAGPYLAPNRIAPNPVPPRPAGVPASVAMPAPASAPSTTLETALGPHQVLRFERNQARLILARLNDFGPNGLAIEGLAAIRARRDHLIGRIQEVRAAPWTQADRDRVLDPLNRELVHWEAALFRLK